MPTASELRPDSVAELADALRTAPPVCIAGAGTRPWGAPCEASTVVSTLGLHRILAHDVGDFTAQLEAGVPLAAAQAAFAEHGQRLCLDPPGAGTLGGALASADSGPLRHRFGAARDLVIGATVVHADGSVAKAGGRVIKNVAGYDLAKLHCGAFGTLGVIASVFVRLHPLPAGLATAVWERDDPDALDALAAELSARPLEAESLDVRWRDGRGAVLCRAPLATLRRLGADRVEEDDAALWDEQRVRQRGSGADAGATPARHQRTTDAGACILRVSAPPRALARVLRAADDVVGRADAGIHYVRCAPDRIAALRVALPGTATLLDAPAELRSDPWGVEEGPALALMRRVKRRFDPERRLNPGVYVGGI